MKPPDLIDLLLLHGCMLKSFVLVHVFREPIQIQSRYTRLIVDHLLDVY